MKRLGFLVISLAPNTEAVLLAEFRNEVVLTHMKWSCVLLLLFNRNRFLIPLRTLANDRLVDTENNEAAGSVGTGGGKGRLVAFCALDRVANFSYPENDRLLRGLDLFLVCGGVKSPNEDRDVKPVDILPRESDEVVRAC
jgi:hypothetical protein